MAALGHAAGKSRAKKIVKPPPQPPESAPPDRFFAGDKEA